jgi:hypothetical protein
VYGGWGGGANDPPILFLPQFFYYCIDEGPIKTQILLNDYLCVVETGNKVKVKVKVKCTLVHALRLCTGRRAHTGSRGITLLFHDHGTRRG